MAALFIGLMSGTSLDGVDIVLAELDQDTLSIIASSTEPYSASLRSALLALNRPDATLEQMLELDVRLGELYAQQVLQMLRTSGIPSSRVAAIGNHGQTIRHHPTGKWRTTLQIGDPNIIAQRTGIATVADFRRRDMAAGGQGAPLVPAFHRAQFHCQGENRVVVNIGGISNITILPGDERRPVTGFDTGPGNLLMDGWAERHLGEPMDKDGAWAARGQENHALLRQLLDDPFFRLPPPKSTGRDHFNLKWLDAQTGIDALPTADVAATLCRFTAETVASAIRRHAPETERVIVCGGGVHNLTLMKKLRDALSPIPVESSAEFGMDPDWVEAAAFAWLAKQTLEGNPGNLPSVTGARDTVVLGGIYR